jgi:hypothetical protein
MFICSDAGFHFEFLLVLHYWFLSNISSASQEVTRILCNPNVHYRVHKNPTLVPILSQINPIHTFPSYFLKNYFNIVLKPPRGFPQDLFPSSLNTKAMCVFLFSLMRAIFPVHPVYHDLMIPTYLPTYLPTYHSALQPWVSLGLLYNQSPPFSIMIWWYY